MKITGLDISKVPFSMRKSYMAVNYLFEDYIQAVQVFRVIWIKCHSCLPLDCICVLFAQRDRITIWK